MTQSRREVDGFLFQYFEFIGRPKTRLAFFADSSDLADACRFDAQTGKPLDIDEMRRNERCGLLLPASDNLAPITAIRRRRSHRQCPRS